MTDFNKATLLLQISLLNLKLKTKELKTQIRNQNVHDNILSIALTDLAI